MIVIIIIKKVIKKTNGRFGIGSGFGIGS